MLWTPQAPATEGSLHPALLLQAWPTAVLRDSQAACCHPLCPRTPNSVAGVTQLLEGQQSMGSLGSSFDPSESITFSRSGGGPHCKLALRAPGLMIRVWAAQVRGGAQPASRLAWLRRPEGQGEPGAFSPVSRRLTMIDTPGGSVPHLVLDPVPLLPRGIPRVPMKPPATHS